MMIEPVSGAGRLDVRIDAIVAEVLSYRHSRDAQRVAQAVVGLHEHAERERLAGDGDDARRRADATFEFVTDHAGAAADVALGHRTGRCRLERAKDVLRPHMETIDVIQMPVPGLRRRPAATTSSPRRRRPWPYAPGDDGIAHDTDAVRVGDQDRPFHRTGFVDPRSAGHLAIAVQCEPAAIHAGVERVGATRQDGGDPRPHFAAIGEILDQRHLPDRHSRHVGDRIQRTGFAFEGHAEIACSRGGAAVVEIAARAGSAAALAAPEALAATRHAKIRRQRTCFMVKLCELFEQPISARTLPDSPPRTRVNNEQARTNGAAQGTRRMDVHGPRGRQHHRHRHLRVACVARAVRFQRDDRLGHHGARHDRAGASFRPPGAGVSRRRQPARVHRVDQWAPGRVPLDLVLLGLLLDHQRRDRHRSRRLHRQGRAGPRRRLACGAGTDTALVARGSKPARRAGRRQGAGRDDRAEVAADGRDHPARRMAARDRARRLMRATRRRRR